MCCSSFTGGYCKYKLEVSLGYDQEKLIALGGAANGLDILMATSLNGSKAGNSCVIRFCLTFISSGAHERHSSTVLYTSLAK